MCLYFRIVAQELFDGGDKLINFMNTFNERYYSGIAVVMGKRKDNCVLTGRLDLVPIIDQGRKAFPKCGFLKKKHFVNTYLLINCINLNCILCQIHYIKGLSSLFWLVCLLSISTYFGLGYTP